MWWEGGNRVNRKHYFVEWEQFFKFERIRARTTMATQITIKDIAKILGISVSTVSRALKNHPDISAETKKEVQELAKKLNYTCTAAKAPLKSSTITLSVSKSPQIRSKNTRGIPACCNSLKWSALRVVFAIETNTPSTLEFKMD